MAEADPAADAKSVAALRAKVSTSRDATQKVRGISCSASPASLRPCAPHNWRKAFLRKPPSSHTPWPVPHDSQEAMQNLAYVVSSANDNIQALQRTIKQQERELAAASDHASALQRNYETLARIRRADQEEFLVVKAQQTEEREQMKQLKAELAAERERCAELERSLQQSAAAQAESQSLKLQLADASRERDDHLAEVERLRGSAAEMLDANKVLKINIDKLSRAQQEMLIKARKSDDALRSLQNDKEVADKASASSASKAAVQERQLNVPAGKRGAGGRSAEAAIARRGARAAKAGAGGRAADHRSLLPGPARGDAGAVRPATGRPADRRGGEACAEAARV